MSRMFLGTVLLAGALAVPMQAAAQQGALRPQTPLTPLTPLTPQTPQTPQSPQAPQPAAQPAPAPRPQPAEGRIYAPGPFDTVAVDGVGQVRLVQSDRDEVFVAGDAGAQDAVDIRLSGRQLHIDLPGGWKFWKGADGAQVEVRLRDLHLLLMAGANDVVVPDPFGGDRLTVRMAGSGVARFDRMRIDQLDVEISGAGEAQLAGKVGQLRVSVSGKGKIGADQLLVDRADVAISGVANASLWVTSDLGVRISGAGHIDYWGQPQLRKSISGWGSVDSHGAK